MTTSKSAADGLERSQAKDIAAGSRILARFSGGEASWARRSEDWNVGLAADLRDPEFAREFLLGAIDEEVPLQVALGKVVRAMGVKPFRLKLSLAPISERPKRRRAA